MALPRTLHGGRAKGANRQIRRRFEAQTVVSGLRRGSAVMERCQLTAGSVSPRWRMARRRVGSCRSGSVSFRDAPERRPVLGPCRPSRTCSPSLWRGPESAPAPVVDPLKRRNCERNVLADHLPILRGRSHHELDIDVPLDNLAQPASSYRTLTYPGAAQRNILGPCRSGDATTASVAIACMAIVVHGFSSGLTHTDEHRRPPGLSTRGETPPSPRPRRGRTCTRNVQRRYRTWRRRTADHPRPAHLRLDIGDPLRPGSSRRYVEHLRYEVGQHDTSLRRQSGDAQTRLSRASGNVEMLISFSDVETVDHRCADRSQLIHDDRVPLLPARRQPGPRRSLNVSDLIGAWHRPPIHRIRRHSLACIMPEPCACRSKGSPFDADGSTDLVVSLAHGQRPEDPPISFSWG